MVDYVSRRGPFAGCPSDADAYVDRLQRFLRALPIAGARSGFYFWRKDYDPTAIGGATGDQHKIMDTSAEGVSPVVILFAGIIGTPVRPPSTDPNWLEMRGWLNANGFSRIALLGEGDFLDPSAPPAGKIPLSGTLFELFGALRSPTRTDVRIFDLRKIALPTRDFHTDAHQQQRAWLDQLLEMLRPTHGGIIISPETDAAFDAQACAALRMLFDVAPFDPRRDDPPGLEALSDESPSLFGRVEDVKHLDARIIGDAAPLTLVLGVSGTGKSSLLRAGLMRDWFRPGTGVTATGGMRALLVEPRALQQEAEEDPLAQLGAALTGAIGRRDRVVGPKPQPLAGPAPHLPRATGELTRDLDGALAWWRQLTAELSGPLVLLIDQAEQVEAIARQEAAARGLDAVPELSPEWLRFTGLIALLTGGLAEGAARPETAAEAMRLRAERPVRIVFSLHRESALDLWPFSEAARAAAQTQRYVVEPIASHGQWSALIENTLKAYGLTAEPLLLDAMASEAAELADEDQSLQAPAKAPSGAAPSRASVCRRW